MDHFNGNTYDLYRDIQLRTEGEIYLGVVGPVRTGKSTFIKRFMELLVLPAMETEEERTRARDELPQSAGGKTITTTEPKFIPQKAAAVNLSEDIQVKVRLIDCVGFMVEGAAGHMEEDKERMVKTPWFNEAIPFTKAAGVGTQKVITDHSTLGIVVTTDGTIGELERKQYLQAEEHTINELKRLQKPFLVLVNSSRPYGEEALQAVEEIKEKYKATAMAVNCMQMKIEDIYQCLREVLKEFPVSGMEFFVPKWVESLPNTHPLKADMIERIRNYMEKIQKMKDVLQQEAELTSNYVTRCTCTEISMATGRVIFYLDVDEQYYYDMLSELTGEELKSQYQLLDLLKGYKSKKGEYEKVLQAVQDVRQRGYGVVIPEREEILLEEPQVVRHGNKFGVKIKAESPSVHMIRANVVTEIAPIVGNEQQAQDLIQYIKGERDTEKGIWETNIFGKTVEQLIFDGIKNKIAGIGEESQQNLQETMQKILNESKGGMIFIII
ncbi:MAG: stage IV sporulation protein A [Lachnospiraceae bacterium]|nr:stage IV sporulation protein A [Lachnospiraceae bacterium]MDD7050665.1 stage IV sporulation protein A [Lachnospiraceae bacterium]MDY3223262.1 stage IV sporulation protein A [Lachnospiraceae bacterium]MDY4096237.1 stage IV sporulation protein A [Lachnospiraceae bacterium]